MQIRSFMYSIPVISIFDAHLHDTICVMVPLRHISRLHIASALVVIPGARVLCAISVQYECTFLAWDLVDNALIAAL